MQAPHDDAADAVRVRGPELGVALVLLALAALVIADSLRVGVGWSEDGPRSGTFPLFVGLMLAGTSAWIALAQLLRWNDAATRREVFAERAQLRQVAAIALPMTAYVALIPFAGIYVASALLIGGFMLRHGTHRAWVTALIALGVPGLAFVVFERWFLVPLPKGPLEAWLGV